MALTKITGQVINTATDVTVGVLTVTDTLAVGGTVSVGGTLTYEDVTNIDSVGLVTARNGIVVGSGITLSKDGDIFATGVTTTGSLVSSGTISGTTGTFSGDVTANGGDMTISGANAILHLVDTNDNPNYRVQNIGGTFQIYDATTDTARLSIASGGAATFSGDVNIADKIIHTGDTNTAIRFPAADTITAETAGGERFRIDSTGSVFAGGTPLTESDLNWNHDTYQIPHIFSGTTGGTPSDGVVVAANVSENPSDSRIGAFIFGCKTSSSSGVQNSGLKAFIEGYTNTNVSDAWKTGGYMKFSTRPDNGDPTERLRIESTGDIIFKNNGGDNRIERNTTSGGPYLLFHNRGTNTTDSSGVYNMGGISAAGYRDVANPGIVGSIQFERKPTASGASSGCDIVFRTGFNGTTSHTGMSEKMRLTYEGHLVPGGNDQYDLGSSSLRWRDIYTGDLNLSNKGKSNDVDGSWGDYTIQEGESDLFLINNRSGKKFKFNLTEVL